MMASDRPIHRMLSIITRLSTCGHQFQWPRYDILHPSDWPNGWTLLMIYLKVKNLASLHIEMNANYFGTYKEWHALKFLYEYNHIFFSTFILNYIFKSLKVSFTYIVNIFDPPKVTSKDLCFRGCYIILSEGWNNFLCWLFPNINFGAK